MLLLTFKLVANRYAIDAERVIELVPEVELRTIPACSAFSGRAAGLSRQGRSRDRSRVAFGLDAAAAIASSTRIILVNDAPDDHNQENGRS